MSVFDSDDEAPGPNLYYDNHFDIDAVKIVPGEYYVTARPILIVTVLGSCIAVCLRDREKSIGGMSHFMLPPLQEAGESLYEPSHYGSHAMDLLIGHLFEMGASRENIEAKLFGGGTVFEGRGLEDAGRRTAEFVRSYLKAARIPVVAEDLHDVHPRKIYFFPDRNKVMVKKLARLNNATLAQREQHYMDRLCQTSRCI